MREIEVKGVVIDEAAVRDRLARAGAALQFEGVMRDRRYDTPARTLSARDEVLRLRVMSSDSTTAASLDFKGAAEYRDGYKIREECSTSVGDADVLHTVLCASGFVVTREIDRQVAVFDVGGATVRVERYPRMDVLVEVEGGPEEIEAAIVAMGRRRADFGTERLADFVRRYEARTGQRAAICDRELHGDYRFRIDDA